MRTLQPSPYLGGSQVGGKKGLGGKRGAQRLVLLVGWRSGTQYGGL